MERRLEAHVFTEMSFRNRHQSLSTNDSPRYQSDEYVSSRDLSVHKVLSPEGGNVSDDPAKVKNIIPLT